MKRSVVVACILLGLIAILHALRIAMGISIVIGGNEVSSLVSVVAILVFGGSAVYLWREASATGD